jgi:trimethylamine:corrinoid methyltransferase-like protein
VIKEAMLKSRNFISSRHTIDYLRSGEIYYTSLGDRQSFHQWDQNERIGMFERAQSEADRILAEHQVPPLTEIQERELDKIMKAAEKELVR